MEATFQLPLFFRWSNSVLCYVIFVSPLKTDPHSNMPIADHQDLPQQCYVQNLLCICEIFAFSMALMFTLKSSTVVT